jgi:hypothetical protein
VADPDLAEDILHDSLLKALQGAPDLRDQDRLVPWFYRILLLEIRLAHVVSSCSQIWSINDNQIVMWL